MSMSEVIEPASRNWRAEVQTSFELMRAVAKHVSAARAAGRFPLVLSGNCLSAVGVIAGLGEGTGAIWIDAHGDFNTPQTTTSGFLDGMTLATATGQMLGGISAQYRRISRRSQRMPSFSLERAILIRVKGPRWPVPEIVRLSARRHSRRGRAGSANNRRPGEKFYVHLDMDALDPSVGRANGYSARGGFSSENLQCLLSTVSSISRWKRSPSPATTLPTIATEQSARPPSNRESLGRPCSLALGQPSDPGADIRDRVSPCLSGQDRSSQGLMR